MSAKSAKLESFRGAGFCEKAFVHESVKFICKQISYTNARSLVLGVSGGVDSAVVARLCQLAIQRYARKFHTPIKLVCVFLPSLTTSAHSREDAKALAHAFSLSLKQHSIAHYQEQFLADFPKATPLEVGNFCARVRMALLYHYSSMYQGIVVGTSNQSELLLGYGTIFGDLACAINPIGALFKTQIFSLARILQLPESIITKPPSADLYPNQSDEGELGFSYAEIDSLLAAIVARSAKYYSKESPKHRARESAKVKGEPKAKPPMPSKSTLTPIHPNALRKKHYKSFEKKLASMVLTRIKANQFKREMPTIFMPKSKLLRELRTDTSSHKATHKDT
ncbi:NAD(+) synthase [uncultured Helicobacter sp.]|uniref:NAD(+) synthase n=1 Tax=uncultured Helicobacter sp. TaxID=175537 RepID=UPI002631B4FF|nr:NAD(+) synthase [uncultured Helicobacter sp.]